MRADGIDGHEGAKGQAGPEAACDKWFQACDAPAGGQQRGGVGEKFQHDALPLRAEDEQHHAFHAEHERELEAGEFRDEAERDEQQALREIRIFCERFGGQQFLGEAGEREQCRAVAEAKISRSRRCGLAASSA